MSLVGISVSRDLQAISLSAVATVAEAFRKILPLIVTTEENVLSFFEFEIADATHTPRIIFLFCVRTRVDFTPLSFGVIIVLLKSCRSCIGRLEVLTVFDLS